VDPIANWNKFATTAAAAAAELLLGENEGNGDDGEDTKDDVTEGIDSLGEKPWGIRTVAGGNLNDGEWTWAEEAE